MIPGNHLFDTHCHLFKWGWRSRYRSGRGDEELSSYEHFRSNFRILRSLVVGYEGEEQYFGNNDYLASIAKGRPWMTPVPFQALPDEAVPAIRAGDTLAMYVLNHESAIAAKHAIRFRCQRGSPPSLVSLNAAPEAIGLLADTIRRCESTWFLISHLGLPGPTSSYSEGRKRLLPLLGLGRLPNVSIKISGQYAASTSLSGYPHDDVQVILDMLAEHCGIECLVWGSDFAPCLDYISFSEAVNCRLPSGISALEEQSVLFRNASERFAKFVLRERNG